jgi:pescadillo protein
MLTFLEFYQTFLSFINYRLYTSVNLVYPPKLDIEKDESGAGLSAYLIQSITDQQRTVPSSQEEQQKQREINTQPIKDTTKQLATLPSKLASLTETSEQPIDTETPPTTINDEENLDTFTSADPSNSLPQPISSISQDSPTNLFQGLHIYLSRETPVDSLTFLLLSFNVSSLSTDPTTGPSPYPESDVRITHQICDRGRLPPTIIPGRKYIQPQWVVDCINRGTILPEGDYVPGQELPAHLSPFVEKLDGKYDPEEEIEVSSDEEEVLVNDEDDDEVVAEDVDQETEMQRLLEAEAKGEKVSEKKSKKKNKKRGKNIAAEEEKEKRDEK